MFFKLKSDRGKEVAVVVAREVAVAVARGVAAAVARKKSRHRQEAS